MISRRNFNITGTLAGVAVTLGSAVKAKINPEGKRGGIIDQDTSHCIAFTKAMNDPLADWLLYL